MHYSENTAQAKRFRLPPLALWAIGALAIVAGSFWITLKVLDYSGASDQKLQQSATKEVRPTSWQTFGRASYQIEDGTVTMQGPDQIFNLLECGSVTSSVDFSIFVESAGVANMQLMFVNPLGGMIGDPAVQALSEKTRGKTTVHGNTPAGTRMVRALIYSPQGGKVVVFEDPAIKCAPLQ